jgi:quercetin dioxygenase-like cupin family protein
MKKEQVNYRREDERGSLVEISRGLWQQINHLTIKKGNSFGGHYHKYKKELFYLVKGEIEILIISDKGGQKVGMKPGDALLIEPYDEHTIRAIEDSEIVELLSKPFSEEDTFTI